MLQPIPNSFLVKGKILVRVVVYVTLLLKWFKNIIYSLYKPLSYNLVTGTLSENLLNLIDNDVIKYLVETLD